MSVTDAKMHPLSNTPVKTITIPFTSATTQTNKVVRRLKPGFKFEIEDVQVDVDTITATLSVDVQIGGVSVLASALTPVAATATPGTLATSRTNRRGKASDSISVMYTSNGTGAVTNGAITVSYRPYPLNGEV